MAWRVGGGRDGRLPFTYNIYQSGGIYYAEADDGTIDFRGAVAETVINSALAVGGVIILKKSVSALTGQILKNSGPVSYLIGEGRGVTHLDFSADLGANPGIYCNVSGCHWEQFTMDMQDNGTHGIELYNTNTNVICDVEILNCVTDGIHIGASAERNSNKIIDCKVEQPGQYGVYIGANVGHTWMERSVVSDSTTSTKVTDAGVYITSAMGQNMLFHNTIWGCIVGIHVATSSYRLKLQDNTLTDCWTSIEFDASNGDMAIDGNTFWYVGRAHPAAGNAQSDLYFNTNGIQYAVKINNNNGNGQNAATAINHIYCTDASILRGVMDGNSVENYGTAYNQGVQVALVIGDNYP